MLLQESQFSVEGNYRLAPEVIVRIGLRRFGLSGWSFFALLYLKKLNGQEAMINTTVFDLNQNRLPTSFEWQSSRMHDGFGGDYLEYVLKHLQTNQLLRLWYQPKANGSVMVRLNIIDQEAQGCFSTEVLANGGYFLSHESVSAK